MRSGTDSTNVAMRERIPRILVVDDEPSIRTFVERALSEAVYHVTGAADGPDALRLLEALSLILFGHTRGIDVMDRRDRATRCARKDLPAGLFGYSCTVGMSGSTTWPQLEQRARW